MKTDFVSIAASPHNGNSLHYLIVDPFNMPKICFWVLQEATLREEVVEWIETNTPTAGVSTTERTILIIFKGERDASLFKLFWMGE